ncbi:MAG TPA: hypothetical protein VGE02_08745 [Gemmatimonadales bacterium]
MRQYRFLATDETVEALRALRGAWAGYRVERTGFGVRLEDGREVCVSVEGAEVEPDLPAFRIGAALTPCDDEAGLLASVEDVSRARRKLEVAPDFAVGRNDIVLFTGATWTDGGPATGQLVQFSGHPGQVADSAAAVCLTTDAMVVASPVGTGFLVRTGVRPFTLEVTDDANDIATFLAQRGYEG